MRGFRTSLRWLWACLLLAIGAVGWAKRRLRSNHAIVVIGLHRVIDDRDYGRTNSLSGILLLRRTFQELAAYVSRRFDIVDASGSMSSPDSDKPRIAFTFDDGWHDNYAHAFPVACSFGISMTIFVCPGLVGRNSPFWQELVVASIRSIRPVAREEEIEAVIEKMKASTPESREIVIAALPLPSRNQPGSEDPDRTLTWAEITEMDACGVAFGAHTQTHQILTMVPESVARSEIGDSKANIERALKKPCRLFAYPNGNHSTATRRFVSEAGFSRAFTTERGAWTTASDPLAIPRMIVSEDDVSGPTGRFSAAMFEYTVFWKASRAQLAKRGMA